MSRKLSPNKTNVEPWKIPPPNEEIPCSWPECQKIFFSFENLEKHFKVHNEGLHKCSYCHKQFQNKTGLNCHIRIHTGEKPYACSLCPKSFSRLNILKSHMRVHTGEKPFKCRICQKSLSTKSRLESHMRIHTGEKPYKCKVCGKSFAYSNSLTVHQRNHNGDKPHECTFCSKSFSQHCNLEGHMRIHTGERPFNCKICSKSFAEQRTLQVHMRTHTDKMSHGHSIGGKCNIVSKRNNYTRKVEESDEPKQPNSSKQQAKIMPKKDPGRRNKGVSIAGATTTRLDANYEKINKQLTLLPCQVCHLAISSLENLCRHYSRQHNLPKVVTPNLAIPKKILLNNFEQ